MTVLNKIQKENLERMIGIEIEQTEVTHIIRTHTEGRNKSQITTLEQSEDFSKWYVQTINGDLVQLEKYQKFTGNEE